MKSLKIFLLFILFTLVVSCEKESSKESGCEVNGLWLGTWYSPENASGTFFAPVTQDNTTVTGDVYIRFDLPSLENSGVDFTGNLVNKKFKSIIDISGVDISVSGVVANDSAISGNFNVTTGMSGVFDGLKIATSTPVTNEIYSSTSRLTSIVYIDQKLWVWTDNYIYDESSDNFNKYVVKRLNLNGILTDSVYMPFRGGHIGSEVSFDGQKIWVLSPPNLYTYDLLGNKLDTFSSNTYFDAEALACIDNQIFITDEYMRVTHVLEQNAEETKTIPNKYISIWALCKHQGNLFMGTGFYNLILKTDKNGNILKAYTLPSQVISISSNGSKVWCLTEKYIHDTSRSVTTEYKIYEVQFD